uniref:Ubiquitin carboxyl-terminal hydrolase n=1 Tax=Ascaris lumbricoides TaxID=6252 RepID=A0A0M3ITT3_ASCLU
MYGIVTQNENGPCPLVAVANVLLLKGQLGLPNKAECISERDLLQCIADCLLRLKPEGLNEGDALNYEQNMSDVLSLVPSLPRGLDVNVQFNGYILLLFKSIMIQFLYQLLPYRWYDFL